MKRLKLMEQSAEDLSGYYYNHYQKAPLVTVAIFTFTNCWNDFMGPLIYLSSERKYTAAFRPAFFYRNVHADNGTI